MLDDPAGRGKLPVNVLPGLRLAGEIGIVGHCGLEQVLVERQLGVGEQHRKLRPCERLRPAPPFDELHIVG